MSTRRNVVFWLAVAAAAMLILLVSMRMQDDPIQRRLAIGVAPDPTKGVSLFEAKGCGNCHHTGNGLGLRQSPSGDSLPRLVTAMWNHAPRMWEAMEVQNIQYPKINYAEAGQLLSYVYLSGFSDAPGDAARGAELFHAKSCARCHNDAGSTGGGVGPDLLALDLSDDPVFWTQVLWNHSAKMQSQMAQAGVKWPTFKGDELRDLAAHLARSRAPTGLWVGDPARGWAVYQQKQCLNCHGVPRPGQGLSSGDAPLPSTYAQFGQDMLNHLPKMDAAMQKQRAPMPQFEAQELADLQVFLYSLHFVEPSGSPNVGASIFTWRGCAQCHGDSAAGGKSGPPLRGRGRTYTAIRLASDLWGHGAQMNQQRRKSGQEWPDLEHGDVGHILSFLNTPLENSP